MPRFIFVFARLMLVGALAGSWPLLSHAGSGSVSKINGQDVNGRAIAVNGTGHYTVVMYTNPDLEDQSRAMTLALDSFRARPDFAFVRVVDLRGALPPAMRGIVRSQIRQEIVREDKRLKDSQGIAHASAHAPIIADFSGSTLDALGWDSVYSQIHFVVYDRHGNEIKRLAEVDSPKKLTEMVGAIL